MRVMVLAIGERPPGWVREAWLDYTRRIPKPWRPELIELAGGARGPGRDTARAIADEGRRVLAALPRDGHLVLLDQRGESWSSVELSRRMARWGERGTPVALVIGGPDGHAGAVAAAAAERWSLSALTLPHALVRVLLAEQIYRAWSILAGHPYHRD